MEKLRNVLSGRNEKNKNMRFLIVTIQSTCENTTTPECIHSLYELRPKKIQAKLFAKEGNTKYWLY